MNITGPFPMSPSKSLNMDTVAGQLCTSRWQPHLGFLHTLNGLCMLLGAGAEHLERAGRCEGPGDPQGEASHHPGNLRHVPSQGYLIANVTGGRAHTGEDVRCVYPSFYPSVCCVSVRLSGWAC